MGRLRGDRRRVRRLGGAAHPARVAAEAATRGTRHHARGGRLLDPRLRIEDQPHGVGTGELQARDVEDLLTLYGVADGAERAALLDLAREANVAGWWHSYSDVLPGWFQTYVGLEARPP